MVGFGQNLPSPLAYLGHLCKHYQRYLGVYTSLVDILQQACCWPGQGLSSRSAAAPVQDSSLRNAVLL